MFKMTLIPLTPNLFLPGVPISGNVHCILSHVQILQVVFDSLYFIHIQFLFKGYPKSDLLSLIFPSSTLVQAPITSCLMRDTPNWSPRFHSHWLHSLLPTVARMIHLQYIGSCDSAQNSPTLSFLIQDILQSAYTAHRTLQDLPAMLSPTFTYSQAHICLSQDLRLVSLPSMTLTLLHRSPRPQQRGYP